MQATSGQSQRTVRMSHELTGVAPDYPMSASKALLLIDEDPNDAAFVTNLLRRNLIEAEIGQATDDAGFAALDGRKRWDVVVVNSRLSWSPARTLLPAVRARWPGAKVILVCAVPGEMHAVEALREDLADFLAVTGSGLGILQETVLGALAVAATGDDESRRLLARSPAGFFRCFADGRLFDCNDALARMLGFDDRVQAMVANRPLVRAEFLRASSLRALSPGGQVDLRLEHREGKPCWGRLHLWPMVLTDTGPAAFEGWVQDVTQRRWHLEMLRQHRETYHTLLEFSPVATAIVGTDGILQQVNAEFERLACAGPGELPGAANYFSFVAPDDVERLKRAHRARIAGKNPPSRYEYDFVNRRGEIRHVQLTAHFVSSRQCTVATHIDLTERLRKENGYKQLAMGLAGDWPDALAGLAACLARALGVAAVVLARPVGDRLEMLAGCLDGRPRMLAPLPADCSALVRLLTGRLHLVVCTEKARAAHPGDRWLHELEAEAFVGLPLISREGVRVGLLFVASHGSLGNVRFCRTAMQIVAPRAVAEIVKRAAPPALDPG